MSIIKKNARYIVGEKKICLPKDILLIGVEKYLLLIK